MQIAQVGEAVLRTPASQVSESQLGSAELHAFVDELLATMLAANGIGIAAPQVFDSRAIMIVASRPNARYPNAPEMGPTVLINPQIIAQSTQLVWEWEGCLSVPGLRGKIARPDWVELRYRNLAGDALSQRFEGFVARVFLHEYDHLIGKVWLDHVQSSEHIMANEVWMKAMEQGRL